MPHPKCAERRWFLLLLQSLTGLKGMPCFFNDYPRFENIIYIYLQQAKQAVLHKKCNRNLEASAGTVGQVVVYRLLPSRYQKCCSIHGVAKLIVIISSSFYFLLCLVYFLSETSILYIKYLLMFT